MENLFLSLLNMSISALWLALAIIAVRFVFKRTSADFRCILWALLAFRLLCPLSIESDMSLVPSADTVPMEIAYEQSPNINSGIEQLDAVVNPVLEATLAPNVGDSMNPLQFYVPFAAYLWLLGAVMMLIYGVISYLHLMAATSASLRVQDNVYICDGISSSFVLGFLEPKIYLDSSLSDVDAEYVRCHEEAHIKRFDHILKPFAYIVLALHWFNPLLWLCYSLFCKDIELACDERVIKNMGLDERKEYSTALLNCSVGTRSMLTCPVAFGEIDVKSRIKAVLKYKKAPAVLSVFALVLCIALVLCFMTNPPKAEPFAPEDIKGIEKAEIIGTYVQTDAVKLSELEEKLSAAVVMTAEPACDFDMDLYLYRDDGAIGIIELPSDGCEVFKAGDKYFDYGINEAGSVLDLFGFERRREELEYDLSGKLIKATSYKWLYPYEVTEYEYSGDRLVAQTRKDMDGVVLSREERIETKRFMESRLYLPDEKGQLVLDLVHQNEYDENGFIRCIRQLNAAGEIISENFYEYDENGKMLSLNQLGRNSTFEYYDNGKRKVENVFDADGNWKRAYEYIYDDNGRVVEYINYEEPGVINYHSKSIYDENGQLTQYVSTDKNGKQTIVDFPQ